VAEHGGRGRARPENTRAGLKAEAFEEALSRGSRRVAAFARQSAAELRGGRVWGGRGAQTRPNPRGRGGGAGAPPPGARGQPRARRPRRSPEGPLVTVRCARRSWRSAGPVPALQVPVGRPSGTADERGQTVGRRNRAVPGDGLLPFTDSPASHPD